MGAIDYVIDVDDHRIGIGHLAALAGIGWGGIKAGCWNHLKETPPPLSPGPQLYVSGGTHHTASPRSLGFPRVRVLREGR